MSAATVAKLDGTLCAVTKEIARLHGDILSAARMSLEKAIRIGELLSRVRASRKGKWLAWLKDNAPFSQKTAWRYMECFDRRDELQLVNVTNLSDAYALLLPAKATGNAQRRSANGRAENVSPAIANERNPTEATPAPGEQTRPQKRRKSKQSIMDQISTENLDRELKESQAGIDRQLGLILDQIRRQSNAAWGEFPDRLVTLGEGFIAEGERLRKMVTGNKK
jgi:hypothetical protein